MARPKKYRGFEVRCKDGTVYAGKSINKIALALEAIVRIDRSKVGEIVTILVVEHTKKELSEMCEWDGW